MRNDTCEAFDGRMRLFWGWASQNHARQWTNSSTRRRSAASIMPVRPSRDGLPTAPSDGGVRPRHETPATFTARITAMGDPLREMERLRASPVATPAQPRQANRLAPVARGLSARGSARPDPLADRSRGAQADEMGRMIRVARGSRDGAAGARQGEDVVRPRPRAAPDDAAVVTSDAKPGKSDRDHAEQYCQVVDSRLCFPGKGVDHAVISAV